MVNVAHDQAHACIADLTIGGFIVTSRVDRKVGFVFCCVTKNRKKDSNRSREEENLPLQISSFDFLHGIIEITR